MEYPVQRIPFPYTARRSSSATKAFVWVEWSSASRGLQKIPIYDYKGLYFSDPPTRAATRLKLLLKSKVQLKKGLLEEDKIREVVAATIADFTNREALAHQEESAREKRPWI